MKEKKKNSFLSFSQAHCHHYIALLSRCASLYNMNMICESKKRVAFEFSEQYEESIEKIFEYLFGDVKFFFLLRFDAVFEV
jgi:hypothetical protein